MECCLTIIFAILKLEKFIAAFSVRVEHSKCQNCYEDTVGTQSFREAKGETGPRESSQLSETKAHKRWTLLK